MNNRIDNEKKLRIELKKLVTFGDYEETLKESFGGFLQILEKCKSQNSTIDDFRILEHMSGEIASEFLMLSHDLNTIMSISKFHDESFKEERINIICNQGKYEKHRLPQWYIDKMLVDTHEKMKEEISELYDSH